MITNPTRCQFASVAVVVLFSSGLEAQQMLVLEEIIVTAQKRVESLQDVPISISAIAGDKLREAGIVDMKEISAYVPNFSMNETGISNAITIRGISSGINQGFEQSVGVYVDGVYYGRGELARAPLFDMQRVEVARGPQPILFGKNSIAGAVSIITAKPTEEFEGSITALYEPDHGAEDLQLILSGPIYDTFRARLGVYNRNFDGYMNNVYLNRKEKQEDETVVQTSVFDGTLGFNVANAAKASIQGVELDSRWAATDNLTLSASLGYLDFEFDNFTVSQCYFNDSRPVTGPGTCDASGDRKEYTPEWTGALIGDYERLVGNNLRFRTTAELIYSDDYIWSPTLDPLASQGAFTKINLRLGIGSEDGTWEVALVGRNLTDEDVSNFGGNATLASAFTGGTGNAYYTFVDRPRSIALQAVYRFGGAR